MLLQIKVESSIARFTTFYWIGLDAFELGGSSKTAVK
jgi:hypothetical protein